MQLALWSGQKWPDSLMEAELKSGVWTVMWAYRNGLNHFLHCCIKHTLPHLSFGHQNLRLPSWRPPNQHPSSPPPPPHCYPTPTSLKIPFPAALPQAHVSAHRKWTEIHDRVLPILLPFPFPISHLSFYPANTLIDSESSGSISCSKLSRLPQSKLTSSFSLLFYHLKIPIIELSMLLSENRLRQCLAKIRGSMIVYWMSK